MTSRERPQRGFAVVAAIFILVVLAALGAFVVTVAGTHHAGAALDLEAARAYQAARAGSEWGLYRAFKGGSPPCSNAGIVTDLGTLDGMRVSVNCRIVASGNTGPQGEAGLTAIYEFVATACNQPIANRCPGNAAGTGYVERRLSVLTERIP